jgi:hypothetical protein
MIAPTKTTQIPFSYPTFQLAKNFIKAYEILKLNEATFEVIITNAALSIELALKALAGSYEIVDFDIRDHVVDGVSFQSSSSKQKVVRPRLGGKGHDLDRLYDSLDKSVKLVLDNSWAVNNVAESLRVVLSRLSNDFQSARYADEKNSKIYGSLEIYDALIDVLLSNEHSLFSHTNND